MEKRQAVEFLEYLLRDKNIERTIYEDALKIAIESLKAQLSREGTTKDAISRQAAIDIFDDYNVSVENGDLEAYSRDRKRLCELPTVQPEVLACGNGELVAKPEPHEGEWIPVHPIQSDDPGAYMCSKCKTGMWEIRPSAYHYCPNCGAKMTISK